MKRDLSSEFLRLGGRRDLAPSSLDRFLQENGTRELTIVSFDKEARTVEVAFSSDIELERWPGVIEQLSHDSGACDLSRLNDGAALLFNHDRNQQIGVIESARIDSDGKGRAVVRFGRSEDAEEKWQDVQDKILTKVSVGYLIKEVKLAEERDNGVDVYVVTKWQPYEISFVTIPADPNCGAGRSIQPKNPPSKKRLIMNRDQMIALLKKRGLTVPDDATDEQLVRMVTDSEPNPEPKPKITVEAERAAGRDAEQTRVKAILDAGEKYGHRDLAIKAVQEGKSVNEFREMLLDAETSRDKQVRDGNKPIGLTDKETRSFSFGKLIRYLCDPAEKSAREAAKFEIEACEAAAENVTHRSLKGTMIPVEVLTTPLVENRQLHGERGTNTISVKTGAGYTGTGGNAIQTTLLASSFIDLLRNRTVLMQLCMGLGGLLGNVDIPKQSTGTSGYWIGEDEDATKNDIDLGIVSLRPKTVANYGEITRKMLTQPSIGIELLLRSDLAKGLALAIDRAGFYGDGTGNAPVGIKSTAGVNSVSFAAVNPTYAELVQMETEIAIDNAEVSSMAYVLNPVQRGNFKTSRRIGTSTDSNTIWEPGNTLNGYRAEVTNQVTAGDVFFGNFADFLIGLWGGLEITVDPFTGAKSGRVRIVAMQDVDFAIRRAQSFCFGVKP